MRCCQSHITTHAFRRLHAGTIFWYINVRIFLEDDYQSMYMKHCQVEVQEKYFWT